MLPSAIQIGAVSPPMLVLIAIVTFGYFKRVATLKQEPRRRVPRARQFSFAGGVVLLVAVPLSPIAVWDEQSFTAHMFEHLLIGDVASLLMVLGLTGPLIQPLMRNPVIAFVRPLAEPIPAFVLWIANLYLWHVPFAFDGALADDWVHVVQHICFFTVGFNVWMALFGPLPKPAWFGNIAKLIYLVLLRMASTALGNFFIFGSGVYYSTYRDSDNPFGLTPSGDQITAGSVMMAEGMFITFALLGWMFFKAAREGEESQLLKEHAQEHGVDISAARTERAAAAGTGERLREQISAASRTTRDTSD